MAKTLLFKNIFLVCCAASSSSRKCSITQMKRKWERNERIIWLVGGVRIDVDSKFGRHFVFANWSSASCSLSMKHSFVLNYILLITVAIMYGSFICWFSRWLAVYRMARRSVFVLATVHSVQETFGYPCCTQCHGRIHALEDEDTWVKNWIVFTSVMSEVNTENALTLAFLSCLGRDNSPVNVTSIYSVLY